mmetsp:Transcript_11362/g.15467  ORF Transcript_11362/g.15467 Transcript_11362/m.15467 type:complete len:917 (+) Transcript_11362:38-2788(+)|eukprot:CAMPEP_0196570866 /NCGR_PEP_ID=MMETSP1081-20130531/1039_1 /TAXON_ID=36882 /ORGANISM="Pyramimonas amylifera, Strain CCMP720" /LENGTH=916 /DNA_ID=CAMNT_0041887547 /DNA_START=32 /DNA_END=2782 /DNA_ORIENTATION=-
MAAAGPPEAGGGLRDTFKKDEDRDEEVELSPFFGIEKGAVLQESRVFNEPQIDVRRCQQVITKLLYLLNHGDFFTKTEATEVFFAGTKLFQSKDINLRRMVYLMIKEICPSSDEVIIVTSSLMKDMNSKTDLYRSNAIRVLCNIAKGDAALLSQVERYLKQAVVDKSPVVASAALVSGMHLLQTAPEIVKRWSNEVQEAVQSKSPLVQAHALALLHQIRQNDRLAVSKLVSSLTRSSVRSPLAQCLLIRYVSQVIEESSSVASGERPFYEFLEGCLRHKAEMVIFEAARAIANMNDVSTRELTPAITVLQLFLSSSKPVLRFAAVRTLNKVAMTHPLAVTNCNIDMESLITDQNRSIATLAITTLLKTGNESSVERLLKQITSFMSDIADEFKIVVVEAIKSLCLKFPAKYPVLMNFLSNILREEGGFDYKKTIVDAVLSLIRDIPDAKEAGLSHLCEFIEDCEFTYLSTQILHLLGQQGPSTSDPAKYIRYIYNRVILENATVRASAVSALAKFGAIVEFLRPRIIILLRRCLHDNDDEVRDRATFYLSALGASESGEEFPTALPLVLSGLGKSLLNMETALRDYTLTACDIPFNLASVPAGGLPPGIQPLPSKTASQGGKSGAASGSGGASGGGATAAASSASLTEAYAEQLNQIPELAALGRLFKSSPEVELTEVETEYAVKCIKHVFPEHVVFQFSCTNTIQEQVLENVSVAMDAESGTELEEAFTLPLPEMPYNAVGHTYVCMQRSADSTRFGVDKFACTLKFTVKEVDPSTGEVEEDGYEDEYQLEDLELTVLDYVQKIAVSNFRKSWEDVGEEAEQTDVYGLGARDSLQDAVEAVMEIMGMQPCEGTEVVPPNARSHTCLLSGCFVGFCHVLVRLYFGVDQANAVAVKVAVRSEDPEVSQLVHQIISEA